MMLSAPAKKWLKILHVYMGGIWCGGAASLFAVHCIYFPTSGPEFYARNIALIYIDYFIIIPAALGSLVTGFLYSQLTNWGYIRHKWIIAKWVITLSFISIGFIWLVPWLHEIRQVSLELKNAPMIDSSSYDVAISFHLVMTVVQTFLLFFIVIISVLKPWGVTRFNRNSSCKDNPRE